MYVGCIDQGTSSSRFILFDKHGQPTKYSSQILIKRSYPQQGWESLDASEILKSVCTCITNVLSNKQVQPEQIAAVGITNQRETSVIWDKNTGLPLYDALVWSDKRTEEEVRSLIARTGSKDYFRKQTGLPINAYFSAMKIVWMVKNVPEIRIAIEEGRALFGTIDTWLIWNLSGGMNEATRHKAIHVTDVSNASRTNLMDLKSTKWDKNICSYLNIPMSILPSIRSSSEHYGNMIQYNNIPITGCLGDQQAALMGQLCLSPGMAKNTYGTGAFMLLNTGTNILHPKGLLTTVAYQLGPNEPVYYALEGGVAVCGSAVNWFRDQMKMIIKPSDIEDMATSEKDNGGVYFVPAFSGLFAPYWEPDARGILVGLTSYANRNHFARSILESAAYQTCDLLSAMKDTGDIKLNILKVDGGMTKNNFLMQFQADILGLPVERAVIAEATAAGAAFAAGLAVGLWSNIDDLKKCVAEGTKTNKNNLFQPQMNNDERNRLYNEWKKAVSRSMHWATKDGKPRSKL